MSLSEDFTEQALDWRSPSQKLRSLRHFEAGAVTLALLIAALAFTSALASFAIAVVVGGCILLAGLLLDVFLIRRVSAWGYAERSEDLIIRRGLMFRRVTVIPYGRMQYVEVAAGPLERSFGLATVQLHTAAAASDARIPGLDASEAARLRDQLTSLGESQAMGL